MNEMTNVQTKPTVEASPAKAAAFTPMNWLRSEIDRLFEDFGSPVRRWAGVVAVPALDVVENGKEYRMTAELPGLAEEDIDINVTDGVLTVAGEKKEEADKKDGDCLIQERRYGYFKRQLQLPQDVDPQQIKASFKDGILTVTMGKDEKAAERSRKIPIGK